MEECSHSHLPEALGFGCCFIIISETAVIIYSRLALNSRPAPLCLPSAVYDQRCVSLYVALPKTNADRFWNFVQKRALLPFPFLSAACAGYCCQVTDPCLLQPACFP